MFECVVNVSEGRSQHYLAQFARAAGPSLRDRHADPQHNRSVFTLINDRESLVDGVRALIDSVFATLDLSTHHGVHPRFGVVDVVPFVALGTDDAAEAVQLRDETARWIAETYDVATFLYGPIGAGTRTLPEVRRGAFGTIEPDFGPAEPSPRLGAVALGARDVLVAWNLWLDGVTVDEARRLAAALRRPGVRALGLELGGPVQVSCNLIDPLRVGPDVVYDLVRDMLQPPGRVLRAELVGLAPRAMLDHIDAARWPQLDLSLSRTIEARVEGDGAP